MSQQKNKSVAGVLMVVFLFFVLLLIFASYTMKNLMPGDALSLDGQGKSGSIAVIEINGAIMESKKVIELLHVAEKDDKLKAIILRVNSPGGAVGPTQEIYEEIRRIDGSYSESEGKEGKPIYASFASVAASGGYYIGAATRRIYSNPGTITGSIGVIMQFMDLSKLYEFAKVNPMTIKAGKYKDVGQPNRPMTAEEKSLLEGMIAGVHQQFIDDIEKTRKDKIKGKLIDLAQGQIFSGEQAHKLGLVDGLKGLWEAGREIHKELKIEEDFSFKFIKKKKKKGIFKILDDLEEVSSHIKDLSASLQEARAPLSIMFK